MDKEVKNILSKYLKEGAKIEDLQSELIKANCIIYKSALPPINGQAVEHIDGTPDKGYPLRILRAYRANCDYRWADTIDGQGIVNPLLIHMNELCEQRAKLLDEVIAVLERG